MRCSPRLIAASLLLAGTATLAGQDSATTPAPAPVPAPVPVQETLGARVDALVRRGVALRTLTPVFSQVVSFGYPSGFELAFENATGARYIQEHIPAGETLQQWTQMITLGGHKDLAADATVTPISFLQQVTAGFQRSCPTTHAVKPLGRLDINGHPGFIALAGCGTVGAPQPHSEVALLVAVQGAQDYYSIQWAERGPASAQPPVLDEAHWRARFQQLHPIRLCTPRTGEKAPYPSCMSEQ